MRLDRLASHPPIWAPIRLPAEPRILLIRLSAIGDVVVTTPVTRALRGAFPHAHVAWVVEPKAAAALDGNPFLDDVIVWDRASKAAAGQQIAAYRRLRATLRRKRFDVAIDFQGLLRSGLIARMSGARFRVGNTQTKEPAERFYTHRVPRPLRTRSSRQRCLDLLRPLSIETEDRRMVMQYSESDSTTARRLLAEAGAPAEARYACLAPFTTWPHKHWRPDRWAALADRLCAEEDLFPVFLGGPADQLRLRPILDAMSGPAADLCGKTSLPQAAAALAGAGVVIAVDTGLLHIAAAVGAPLVGLCGASYWPGFEDYENFRLVREPFPCSPCLHHPICRHVDCMEAIVPAAVLAACRDLTHPGRIPIASTM